MRFSCSAWDSLKLVHGQEKKPWLRAMYIMALIPRRYTLGGLSPGNVNPSPVMPGSPIVWNFPLPFGSSQVRVQLGGGAKQLTCESIQPWYVCLV